MSGPVRLRYHQATFDLLGRQPVVSGRARRQIEKAERKCGRLLPAAVREWYELEGAEYLLDASLQRTQPLRAVLADHTASGAPGLLDRLWSVVRRPRGSLFRPVLEPRVPLRAQTDLHLLAERRLLVFCEFDLGDEDGWVDRDTYVNVDGDEDPPVIAADAARVQRRADHLSTFLFDSIWWGMRFAKNWVGLSAEDLVTGPGELDYLRDHFQESSSLPWSNGEVCLLFFAEGMRVRVLMPAGPVREGKTAWEILAVSTQKLTQAFWKVRGIGVFTQPRWRGIDPMSEHIWLRFLEESGFTFPPPGA
jgi:hypothetical protein